MCAYIFDKLFTSDSASCRLLHFTSNKAGLTLLLGTVCRAAVTFGANHSATNMALTHRHRKMITNLF